MFSTRQFVDKRVKLEKIVSEVSRLANITSLITHNLTYINQSKVLKH